jgi:hypothetical protein
MTLEPGLEAAKGAPRSYRNLKERLERGDWRASDSAGATHPTVGLDPQPRIRDLGSGRLQLPACGASP